MNQDREVGIGNHDGPTAVTVDSTGLYLSTGISENISQMTKLTPSGDKRIWSAAQPDVSMGRYSLSVMNGTLYGLQQDGWVSYQGVNEPNFPSSSVGETDSTKGNGNYVGSRWDALWPGEKRWEPDDWRQLEIVPQKRSNENPMDMIASSAGGTAQLALFIREEKLCLVVQPPKWCGAGQNIGHCAQRAGLRQPGQPLDRQRKAYRSRFAQRQNLAHLDGQYHQSLPH